MLVVEGAPTVIIDYNVEPGVAVVKVKAEMVGSYATDLPMYVVYKLASRGEIALYNKAFDDKDLEQSAYLTSKVLGRFPWKVVMYAVQDFGTEPLRLAVPPPSPEAVSLPAPKTKVSRKRKSPVA